MLQEVIPTIPSNARTHTPDPSGKGDRVEVYWSLEGQNYTSEVIESHDDGALFIVQNNANILTLDISDTLWPYVPIDILHFNIGPFDGKLKFKKASGLTELLVALSSNSFMQRYALIFRQYLFVTTLYFKVKWNEFFSATRTQSMQRYVHLEWFICPEPGICVTLLVASPARCHFVKLDKKLCFLHIGSVHRDVRVIPLTSMYNMMFWHLLTTKYRLGTANSNWPLSSNFFFKTFSIDTKYEISYLLFMRGISPAASFSSSSESTMTINHLTVATQCSICLRLRTMLPLRTS